MAGCSMRRALHASNSRDQGAACTQVKQASVLRGLEQAHVESGVDRAADLLHSVAAADPPRAIALSASLASELSSPTRDPGPCICVQHHCCPWDL